MTVISARKAIAVALVLGLSACSTNQVIDNTVDVASGATKLAAKGAVGAGKLVYRGVASDE